MGAGQSSTGGNAPSVETEPKTSYYDLLGVERQATEDEIKKAYRRKALELHPDRNYGNVESATQLFADVQSAYEVLSDPQERAWYDSHEHSILKGGDGSGGENGAQHEHYERNVRLTTADEISRIILKFNARVEFTDSPSGFFGFLRDTFDDIVSQEAAVAASASQLHPSDAQAEIRDQYPSFGHRDDSHDDIRSFYAAWSAFSTRRSYAWVDRWRPSDAPDRRTRRLVEKENRRLRDDAIQEFNDAVRALVEFSRKRDPRYKPTTQSDAERQKILKDAAAAQRARARAANEERLKGHVVPDWAKSQNPEPNQMEAGEEIWDEEEKELEEFECVACHKTFKSEKQYEAHEKSKKHQKALHALRKQMRKDNVELDLDEAARSDDEGEFASRSESEAFARGPGLTTDENWSDQEPVENDDSDGHSAASDPISSTQPTVSSSDTESSGDYDDEYAPQEKVMERFVRDVEVDEDLLAKDDSQSAAQTGEPSKPKMGKAAQKRAKKAAQKASTEAAGSKNQFTCATCTAAFPSRSRLFEHIKDFRHAAPVTTTKKVSGKGAKRR